jgi:hypothetical protein
MNVELACKLGMKCAIAAQCLWDGTEGKFAADVEVVKGQEWIRMGHKELSLLIPYLTSNMTKSALRRLVKAGIVRTLNLNQNPFDHTYWYAFTSYGICLMAHTADREE